MGIRTTSKHGTSQLQAFNSLVEQHGEEAETRHASVLDRIAGLENELADLRQLRRRLEAARAA